MPESNATAGPSRRDHAWRLRLRFVLLALVTCALVNPGNFGAIDTTRRWQVARWIRLGEPEVSPADTAYGVTGRDGRRHSYTGIGQSLVLVPFDALVDALVVPPLSRFQLDAVRQKQIAELAIAFLMQSFVTACVLLLAYETLLAFQFTPRISAAGALGLLFATSCLAYVQSAQENELLLALALCALWSVRRFLDDPRAKWAALAGSACAFAILTRASALLEASVFAAYALTTTAHRKRFLAGYLPPLAAAVLFDRWYQYFRFGDAFSTYLGIAGKQLKPPTAPPSYPFSYPFWKGFLGALFSPDKSIFLFDPLLVVLILLLILGWRILAGDLKRALAWLALLELAYIATTARYFAFGGDVAWGHRYVIMPVELLALFAIPVLLRYGPRLAASARRAFWVLVCASVILQAGSTAIAPNLEIEQRKSGSRHGVIVNRAVNLIEITFNTENSARFAGVPVEWRTLAYFPFQLRFRFPALARWALATWLLLLASLPILIRAVLRAAGPRTRLTQTPPPSC